MAKGGHEALLKKIGQYWAGLSAHEVAQECLASWNIAVKQQQRDDARAERDLLQVAKTMLEV